MYTSHSPAGTSVKNIVHYAQSIDSGKFQMFNYGPEENIKIYNQVRLFACLLSLEVFGTWEFGM